MARLKDPQRQALILDTALDLFAKRGFHAVSVKDIAAAANISLGSLYTYFESKEHLVNVLFRQCKLAFSEFTGRGIEEQRGREAHRTMWLNIGRFIMNHPKAFTFLESQLHATYLDEESTAVELAISQAGTNFYLERFELALTERQAQLAISATFGAFVQVFKAAQVNLIQFNDDTLADLEKLGWRMASGH